MTTIDVAVHPAERQRNRPSPPPTSSTCPVAYRAAHVSVTGVSDEPSEQRRSIRTCETDEPGEQLR